MKKALCLSLLGLIFFCGSPEKNPYDTSCMEYDDGGPMFGLYRSRANSSIYLSIRGDNMFDLYFADQKRGVFGKLYGGNDTVNLIPLYEYAKDNGFVKVDSKNLDIMTAPRKFVLKGKRKYRRLIDITDYSGYPMPD